jgi:hypothetical protein
MCTISNYFVGSLCSALILVPFIGYLVGSFIKGGVAIGTTYYTGKQCIDFCEKHFESKNIISVYKESAYNYNKAIKNLLKISEDFKRLNKK